MERSRRSSCGLSFAIRRSASSPSPASPTTLKSGWLWRMLLTPVRTMGWSSARSTVIFFILAFASSGLQGIELLILPKYVRRCALHCFVEESKLNNLFMKNIPFWTGEGFELPADCHDRFRAHHGAATLQIVRFLMNGIQILVPASFFQIANRFARLV